MQFRISGLGFDLSLSETIALITPYAFELAISLILRSSDKEIIKKTITKEYMQKYSVEKCDELTTYLIEKFEYSYGYVLNSKKNINYFGSNELKVELIEILVELLSRFCCKNSFEMKLKILEVFNRLYAIVPNFMIYNVDKMMDRVLDSFHPSEIINIVDKILDFPIIANIDFRFEYPNPIIKLLNHKNSLTDWQSATDLTEKIAYFLREMGSDDPKIFENQDKHWKTATKRDWCMRSLLFLHEIGKLTDADRHKFSDLIWSRRDSKTKLPDISRLFKSVFVFTPHPDAINPIKLFKNYVQSTSFPLKYNPNKSSISWGYSDFEICNAILFAIDQLRSVAHKQIIIWNDKEIIGIILRLIDWWDNDKNILKESDGRDSFSMFDIRGYMNILVNILAQLILYKPDIKLDVESNSRLKNAIREMESHKIPVRRLQASCSNLYPEFKTALFTNIDADIKSNDESVLRDIHSAINNYLTLSENIEINNFLEIIGYGLIYRPYDAQKILFDISESLVEQFTKFKAELPGLFMDKLLQGLLDAHKQTYENFAFKHFNDYLAMRKAAAGLAYAINIYNLKLNVEHQEIIIKWRELCLSQNEFSDVRNAWPNFSDGISESTN